MVRSAIGAEAFRDHRHAIEVRIRSAGARLVLGAALLGCASCSSGQPPAGNCEAVFRPLVPVEARILERVEGGCEIVVSDSCAAAIESCRMNRDFTALELTVRFQECGGNPTNWIPSKQRIRLLGVFDRTARRLEWPHCTDPYLRSWPPRPILQGTGASVYAILTPPLSGAGVREQRFPMTQVCTIYRGERHCSTFEK